MLWFYKKTFKLSVTENANKKGDAMGVKALMEKVLPTRLMVGIKNFRQTIHLYKDSFLQACRFNRNYSHIDPKEQVQVETRVMFLTHQIEKGLSHGDFRYGFGKKIFNELPFMLNRMEQIDINFINNTVYRESMAALHEYMARHMDAGQDVSWQKSLFTGEQWEHIINADLQDGGSLIIRQKDKLHNSELTFMMLNEHRHSVREFSDEPVSLNDLEQAIQMSMRTPSVCNRQPTRIHVIRNKQLIQQALNIQGGVNGYPLPPVLILITSDLRAFMTSYERNEGFTDGGLFGMTLLLALESMGLGSCPLNTMFNRKAEKSTRKLLNLPDYEMLVMYIEVGHFKEQVKTCKSTRFNGKTITTVHE